MQISKALFIFLLAVIFTVSSSFRSANERLDLKIIWVDDFSSDEKEKLQMWIYGISEAVANTLGKYPFEVNIYLHRSTGNEPVPWAHTSRTGEQAVHFHVNPSFSLQNFQEDWTAAHEISHLSIPFVGKENMWFSEGYASFWQWQILANQGVFTVEEIRAKYEAKLNKIAVYYQTEDTFVTTNQNLKKQHNYPAVYWGGACYFFKADERLREQHNTSMQEVITEYQHAGRMRDESLEALVLSLDKISASKVFSTLLLEFKNGTGKQAIEGASF